MLWRLVSNTTRLSEKHQRDLRSVCIFLGPYRNLTTFTSALLSLHPNCQVLNHAFIRIHRNNNLNFFSDYSEDKFSRFCQFALFASQRGRGNVYGGSITFSHAFKYHEIMRQTYCSRYGKALLKKTVKNIVWKDSLRISRFLRENSLDLYHIFKKNSKIKFIMPIRNPLDCAISNFKKGSARQFARFQDGVFSVEDILDEVLKELLWFLRLWEKFPKRFMYFFQYEFDRDLLIRLANFLEIEPEERWINDSLKCIDLKESYECKKEWIELYKKLINSYFEDYPAFLNGLKKFIS